jgi:hypothetical protein
MNLKCGRPLVRLLGELGAPNGGLARRSASARSTVFSDMPSQCRGMQRTLISVTIFLLVMFIFDMLVNGGAISRELFIHLQNGGRNVDNFASGLVAFLRH